jgi:uncharacterized membrane protein
MNETGREGVVDRLVFFSDAVFAIAITLLVIGLEAPVLAAADPDRSLADALVALAGHLFAFVVGFLVIGSYWVSHLRIFRVVARLDMRLIWLNLVFLFWIVAMPFVTGTLGANNVSRGTVILFAAVQVAAGAFQMLVWRYVTGHGELLRGELPVNAARNVMLQLAAAPVVFAFSIPVALVAGPVVAAWTWATIALVGWLFSRLYPPPVTRTL